MPLPSAHFEDAGATGRSDTRIAVGGLPDAARRTLLTARGLDPGGARGALLHRLRPPAPDAPMGHCDFSLPSPPQLRSLLVALGASCDGSSAVLSHRSALIWAKRGAMPPPAHNGNDSAPPGDGGTGDSRVSYLLF